MDALVVGGVQGAVGEYARLSAWNSDIFHTATAGSCSPMAGFGSNATSRSLPFVRLFLAVRYGICQRASLA